MRICRLPVSTTRTFARLLLAVVWLCCTTVASAQPINWYAVADVKTIVTITVDEDGTTRETTIWLVVVDGQGYIRTSGWTEWGKNIQRNPDIGLRIGETEQLVRASFVTDEGLRQRIVDTFREKYGWFDGFLNIFRRGSSLIMRLDERIAAT